jgi:cell division protein ZapA (FtsZ GTPase activity inhibitor)
MSQNEPTVVTVQIAGEEYKLRAQATPEYTRECAEYLDRMIREIRQQAPASMEVERLAILAGLALTDQLLQARREADEIRSATLETTTRLTSEIEKHLHQSDLASTS